MQDLKELGLCSVCFGRQQGKKRSQEHIKQVLSLYKDVEFIRDENYRIAVTACCMRAVCNWTGQEGGRKMNGFWMAKTEDHGRC